MQQQHTPELTSSLLETNQQLKLTNGVYQNTDTQIRDSRLSSYIQGAVNDSYNSVSDLSLFSIEIEKLLLTNELREALSPAPYNFLLSLNLADIGHTLDLTQDFGGVSHYLADKVNAIDSIKIDLGHAQLSSKRCAAFDNINIISEDIAQLTFPKQSYDLIVVSQLEDLGLNKNQQSELLKKLQLALKKTGQLVVNVRNQERLNRVTSSGSDIIAYRDLYMNNVETDFTISELEATLKKAGFLHWDSYASFSLDRSVQNLFSEDYLSNNPHSLNHFNRLGGVGNGELNEYLLFKNLLAERGQVFDLASRFLMIASVSATRSRQLCHNNFAHFSGSGRKPQWRTTTQCEAGSGKVSKTLVHPNYSTDTDDSSEIKLTQSTDIQEFFSGELLLDHWLTVLLNDKPTEQFQQLVDEYSLWLRQLEQSSDFSAHAYDVLPFNIIVESGKNEGGRNFHIIDPEWAVDAEFGADFILFRALFWFAFENKALLKGLAKHTGLPTIGLFVMNYMDSVESHQELAEFVAMEEEIQRQIGANFRNRSIEYALLQTFDGEPINQQLQPVCQVSWSDEAGIVDEHNSVFISWKAGTKEQILNHKSPSFVKGKHILRIDPIATMGLFKFSSVALKASDGSILWQLRSASEIAEASDGLNVSLAKTEHGEGTFTALNEDPHFLFNLSELDTLDTVDKIEITFSLLHNQYYDNSLAALSKAVSEQNVALFQQVGALGAKEAEVEYLSAKLKNIDEHRQALKASIHEAQQAHEAHADNLAQALEAQTQRMQQLESSIIIRMIFRARRIASRLLAKFTRKN